MTTREALHAPFRPVRSVRVALGMAAAQFTVFAVLAVWLPAEGPVAWQWYDRLGLVAIGGAVAGFLAQFARVRATPSETGLRVRNLLLTEEVAWDRISRVRFGGGGPWAVLDLADGETLNVMAVQRSDGDRAVAESRRLATLVELHHPA